MRLPRTHDTDPVTCPTQERNTPKMTNHTSTNEHLRRPLTPIEESHILANMARNDPTMYAISMLSLRTGMRLSECALLPMSCALTMNLINQAIDVPGAIAKRAQSRILPLTEDVRHVLGEYLDWRRSRIDPREQTTLLFMHPTRGDALTPRWIQRHYSAAAANSYITGTSFHTLRHTFADRLRQVVDLPTLQMLLGHRHLASTQVYTHPTQDQARSAIERAFGQQPPLFAKPGAR